MFSATGITINWGDGSAATTVTTAASADAPDCKYAMTATHKYATTGTFTITLNPGTQPCVWINVPVGCVDAGVPPTISVPLPAGFIATATARVIADPDLVTPVVAGAEDEPHCVVPNLKGLTLKRAKKKLKAAGCKLGIVAHKATKSKKKAGKIARTSPKPGTELPVGAEISIILNVRA
jgi:hypothetical protein